MRSLSISLVSLGLLAACGDLKHDNPHDPQTPTQNQARAMLVGQVALEPAGAVVPSVSGIHVSVAGHSWSADTDADGKYAISDVPVGIWTVQFTRPGWDDDAIAGITVTLDDGGKDLALPDVLLHVSRGNVSGKVSLTGETTSGGVAVTLTGGGAALTAGGAAAAVNAAPGELAVSTFTDPEGSFLLTGVPVGTYTLDASKLGFQSGGVATVVVTASAVTLLEDLLLQIDPGSFQGQILVSGAASQGGVTVRASGATLNGSPWESTTVNRADGSYLFSGLPGGTYTVSFERDGYGTVTTAGVIVPGKVTDLAPVTLQRDTGAAFGLVRLEGTADASGVQVALAPDLSSAAVATALTDASGTWRLDGVPVGTYVVTVRRQPGWAVGTSSVTIASHAASQVSDVTLAAIPGLLRGQVLLEGVAAGALDGTTVRVEGTTLSTATLADGSWVLTGVASGNHTVVYERSGFDAQRVQVVTVPAGDLTLSGATLAVSRGGVGGTFALQDMPSSAGIVVSASGPASASTVTDATGAFVLSGLPVGTYAITARLDPGWQPVVVTGVVVSAALTAALPGGTRTLLPVDTASLSGTVLLERPLDASGTTVTVTGQDFRGGAVSRTATSGAKGEWTVGGLLAGTYQVGCSHPSYDPCVPIGLAVPAGAAVTVTASTLPVSLGAVGGTVELSAGTVVGFPVGSDRSGVVVTLAGADVPVPAAVTDAAGHFRFEGVPVSLSGSAYTVTARAPSYLPGGPVSVTATAGLTAPAPAITLALDPGGLTGTVELWDDVGGAGANADASGATVTATGTAFNGAAWSASTTTAASGAFTLPTLPKGTYDLVATSAWRTCAAFARASVPQGALAAAGSVRCTDARAPGAVTLDTSKPPLQGGYTNTTAVSVPIGVAASDPSNNLRGYQTAVGLAPDWASAAVVTASPLSFTIGRNARTVLWVRAVDWVGNTGPVSSVELVEDDLPPDPPKIATARQVVNATTAAVTLSGSEGDATFLGYQACTTQLAVTGTEACPASAGCPLKSTASSYAVDLKAGERTCVYAQGVDRAGNASTVAVGSVVSDLTAPSPPSFVPSYDPYQLSVRAPWVDFFVSAAATDTPGSGAAWTNIAYIDVDTGAGFQPLCPSPTCQVSGKWSPCDAKCSCADARRLCDGTRFVGVRAPLSEGTSTTVAFRAVDLAGNVGAGVSQQVFAGATSDVVAATSNWDQFPTVHGSLVGFNQYTSAVRSQAVLLDLGPDLRAGASDASCVLTTFSADATPAVPVSDELVVYPVTWEAGQAVIEARRPGADGRFCTADDPAPLPLASYATPSNGHVQLVAGAGEVVAWNHTYGSPVTFDLQVLEPGPNGVLDGGGDDVPILLANGAGLPLRYAASLKMGPRAILLEACGLSAPCDLTHYKSDFRVYSANEQGSFQSGVTTFDLPTSARAASISADGELLAWTDGAALKLQLRGADKVFGAGDATAAAPGLTGLSLTEVAVDGNDVVALASPAAGLYVILDWRPGVDGVWGTADDQVRRVRQISTPRKAPSLAGGLLVFAQGNDYLGYDLASVDLTSLRWEEAPLGTTPDLLAVSADGALFYAQPGAVKARTAAGATTTGPAYSTFAAGGTDLLLGVAGTGAVVYGPNASGDYFGAAGQTLLATASSVDAIAMGEGKAVVREAVGSNLRYTILEPHGGTLHGGGVTTVGPLPSAAGVGFRSLLFPAVTSRQAFFACPDALGGARVPLCVYDAGTDREFGTTDDPIPIPGPDGIAGTADDRQPALLHAPNHPMRPGQVVIHAQVAASNALMLLSETAHSTYGSVAGTYLRDPGPNGVYDQVDDRERQIATVQIGAPRMAVAGSWAAWIDTGPDGGDQVFVVHGYEGSVKQVTSHYSQKSGLGIDANGRTVWVDRVMSPSVIMTYVP